MTKRALTKTTMAGQATVKNAAAMLNRIFLSNPPTLIKDFPAWEKQNAATIKHAKKSIEEWTLEGRMLRVDWFSCYTTESSGRRMRTLNNYICRALDISPDIIHASYAEKMTSNNNFSFAILSPYFPRVLEQTRLADLQP